MFGHIEEQITKDNSVKLLYGNLERRLSDDAKPLAGVEDRCHSVLLQTFRSLENSPFAMDPITILASLTTVATGTGELAVSLSKAIYTIKHAPKEWSELADELRLLASWFETLKDVVDLGNINSLYKSRFARDLESLITRVSKEQQSIKRLIERNRGRDKFKWALIPSRATSKLKSIQLLKASLESFLRVAQFATEYGKTRRLADQTPTKKLHVVANDKVGTERPKPLMKSKMLPRTAFGSWPRRLCWQTVE